jgi:hypothetical protein
MTRTNTNLLSDSVTGKEKSYKILALGLRSLDEDEVLAASGISLKPKNLLLPREHPETLLELPRLQESPEHHLLQKRSIFKGLFRQGSILCGIFKHIFYKFSPNFCNLASSRK